MARPRKNDPRPLLKPLLEQFARDIATAVEQATIERVLGLLNGAVPAARRTGGTAPLISAPARKREMALCYYPGCKNVAAPRFGMFCAAQHKNLPKTEKEKYRAQHRASQPVVAKRATRS
jgi:hypothetical protein